MCDFSPAVSNLLSGFAGAVIGAGSTILATSRAISSSAEQFEKQRKQAERAEYKQRLNALTAEVSFNISLTTFSANKKIPVFSHAAWDNFHSHAHYLESDVITTLTRAYGSQSLTIVRPS